MECGCIARIYTICFLTTTIVLKFVISQDLEIYLHSNCSEQQGHYDQGSEYQSNVHYLLTNLTSIAGTRKFYNVTIGEGPNRVYGLFLCSSVYDTHYCSTCIKYAANRILQTCPTSVKAITWYLLCMLRYANHNIFGASDVSSYYYAEGEEEVYRRFNGQLTNALINVFDTVAIGSSSLMSAATVVQMEGNITVSPYVDCTPDLNLSACRRCLQTGLDGPRFQRGGARRGVLVQPSCRFMFAFEDSSFASAPDDINQKLYIGLGIISAIAAIFLIIIVILIRCLKRRTVTRKPAGLEEIESMESLRIDFEAIKTATYNFSEANKLGKGGFGIVYMGTLADGQTVAVKRLSNASGQGIREFKTEACLAAKLQHKNLVKVYGFCLEGIEMLLVYEYVPNKSLDRILFDAKRGSYLNWETRYKIIVGIARGLVYLHEDSCPKIVHRDLKPSNILLDGEMNPKIADFGMAKLFGGDQTQGNTSRIAGTFGYMAPEYAASGHFSVKSDVFSYGVIILEVISGLKNRNMDPNAQEENLLRYAWRLMNERVHFNLVDAALENRYSREEVERCIQVGLLCTQDNPAKRPDMDSVLIMLNAQFNSKIAPPTSPPSFSIKLGTPAISLGSCGAAMEDVTELSPR